MQIFTVTHEGRPLAIVRAVNAEQAIAIARELAKEAAMPGMTSDVLLNARDPDDAEMVSWLEKRINHLWNPAESLHSLAHGG